MSFMKVNLVSNTKVEFFFGGPMYFVREGGEHEVEEIFPLNMHLFTLFSTESLVIGHCQPPFCQ